MHNLGVLGALIIFPSIFIMNSPIFGAIIFYGFVFSVGLNLYLIFKKK